jgi:hypothetical protein
MKVCPPLLLPLLLTFCLSGVARAQFPLPFGGGPPESGIPPQCSKAYVKSIEEQIAGMEKLRASGPALVGQICSLIEAGSDIFGGELPEAARQQLKDLLGVDVDLRFIKTQCRVGQGNFDRELMSQIGYLKSERMRCNDTI